MAGLALADRLEAAGRYPVPAVRLRWWYGLVLPRLTAAWVELVGLTPGDPDPDYEVERAVAELDGRVPVMAPGVTLAAGLLPPGSLVIDPRRGPLRVVAVAALGGPPVGTVAVVGEAGEAVELFPADLPVVVRVGLHARDGRPAWAAEPVGGE